MLVKLLHTGSCGGRSFERGQVLDLPEEVLKALGQDAYIAQEQPIEIEDFDDEAAKKKLNHPPKDKQMKHSANK